MKHSGIRGGTASETTKAQCILYINNIIWCSLLNFKFNETVKENAAFWYSEIEH